VKLVSRPVSSQQLFAPNNSRAYKVSLPLRENKWIKSAEMGWTGAMVFSLCAWFAPALANIGLLLMLIALLTGDRQRLRLLWQDSLFRLFLVLVVYLFVQAGWFYFDSPELLDQHWLGGIKMLLPFLFFLPAIWMQGEYQRIVKLLLLALAGLVVGILANQDWAQWHFMIRGLRSGHDRWWYTTAGLFAATALVGIMIFLPRLVAGDLPRKKLAARCVVLSMILLLLTQAVIVSQSRNIWLGLALVGPVALIAVYRNRLPVLRLLVTNRMGLAMAMGIVACVGALLLFSAGNIDRRLGQEHDAVSKLFGGDIRQVPISSLGLRFHLNRFGYLHWLQRPVFGWGGDHEATKKFRQLYEVPENILAEGPLPIPSEPSEFAAVWTAPNIPGQEDGASYVQINSNSKFVHSRFRELQPVRMGDVIRVSAEVQAGGGFDGRTLIGISLLDAKKKPVPYEPNAGVVDADALSENHWIPYQGFILIGNPDIHFGQYQIVIQQGATRGFVRYRNIRFEKIVENSMLELGTRVNQAWHLHNTYLEIAVRLGVVGFVLYLVAALLLVRVLVWNWRSQAVPVEIAVFAASAMALTAIWCLTDFRLIRLDFRLYVLLITGVAYSMYLYRDIPLVENRSDREPGTTARSIAAGQ